MSSFVEAKENNSATGESALSDVYERLDLAIFIVQLMLSVTGIVGNSLVCVTIARAKFMHNVTNFIIAHMAVADILVCVSLVIFQERYVRHLATKSTVGREIVCKLFWAKIMFWLTCDLSILSMLCVTVERYVAIVHPLKHPRLFTKTRLGLMVVAVWCLSVLAQIPIMTSKSSTEAPKQCHADAVSHKSTVSFFVVGIVSFLGPVVALFWCYGKILVSLQNSAQQQRRQNNPAPAKELLMARRRVIKVLLIVSVLYLIIWLPVHVLLSLVTFHKGISHEVMFVLLLVEPTVAVTNSVVNPFVYAFKYKEFQNGVRNYVFAFWFRRQRVADALPRVNDMVTVIT